MEQQLERILTAIASDTLEKLAFLFAFADEERAQDGPDPALTGRVDFNGHFDGSLWIRISTSAMPELAGNMLGADDDAQISDAEQRDALKELLNVICGNALPAIAGDQVEFNIEAPEVLSPEDAAELNQKNKPACVVRLMLEDGFCDLYFLAAEPLQDLALSNGCERAT